MRKRQGAKASGSGLGSCGGFCVRNSSSISISITTPMYISYLISSLLRRLEVGVIGDVQRDHSDAAQEHNTEPCDKLLSALRAYGGQRTSHG